MRIIFLLLVMIKTSYSQTEFKMRTSESIGNEITSLILENNHSRLWEFCSDEFKSKYSQQDLTKLADSIHLSFKENNINEVNDLQNFRRSGDSKNIDLIKKITIEKTTIFYSLFPKYFGKITPLRLTNNLGTKIEIVLLKLENEWKLDDLKINYKYLMPDFNIDKYIQVFLSKATQYNVSFNIVSDQKILNGKTILQPQDLDAIRDLSQSSYISYHDILMNDKITDLYTLSLSYVKSDDLTNTEKFFASVKPQWLEIYLEIIFCPTENQFLITTGDDFAIYKIEDLEKLSDLKKLTLEKLMKIE
jgi:hypothetical protein